MSTKKPGPPTKPPEQHRRRRISVYVTDDEYELIQRNAGHRSVAAFMRESATGGAAAPVQVPEVNRHVWRQLARTAANLNQLTHRAHRGERVCDELSPVLDDLVNRVERLRDELHGGDDEG